MLKSRKIIFKVYTMVEILVVLSIVGILMGIAVGGISGLMGRQGASGAVRNIGTKLSLARSYAVMKNSYVALLIPDDNPNPPNTGYSTGFTADALKQAFYYTSSRLCIVTSSATSGIYTFSEWIDGSDWETLPKGACAYILDSQAKVETVPIIFDGVTYTVSTPAVVFKPSGVLANSGNVTIKAFIAKYIQSNPVSERLVYETKSGKLNAWQISVNPFTGRAYYEKKTDN